MSSLFQRVTDCGVIAVLRAKSTAELMDVANALYAGGVTAIEVTMTTPGALDVIKVVSAELGGKVVVGVGSVLDPETARAAILAGADYVVAPTLNEAVVRITKRYGKVSIPGAFTPTEILRAWDSGADAVKVFPTSSVGPQYLKDLKGPLPQIPLVPTGGVSVETCGDFIRAGAVAVGAGSALVDSKAVAAGDWATITDTAKRMVEEVRKARAGS
jgi:2-dehydro-3-deoxyphosphogluconate aldolase/(4S)-4-hydroxy-2-oxoglutarate aldolase